MGVCVCLTANEQNLSSRYVIKIMENAELDCGFIGIHDGQEKKSPF